MKASQAVADKIEAEEKAAKKSATIEAAILEKVSRAICVQQGSDPNHRLNGEPFNWSWELWKVPAKVAIATVRNAEHEVRMSSG